MSLILTLIGIALVLFFFEILIPGGLLAILGVLLMFSACVVAYIEMGVMAAIITFLLSMILALADAHSGTEDNSEDTIRAATFSQVFPAGNESERTGRQRDYWKGRGNTHSPESYGYDCG